MLGVTETQLMKYFITIRNYTVFATLSYHLAENVMQVWMKQTYTFQEWFDLHEDVHNQ